MIYVRFFLLHNTLYCTVLYRRYDVRDDFCIAACDFIRKPLITLLPPGPCNFVCLMSGGI